MKKPRRLGTPIRLVYAGILREERGVFLFPRLVRELLDRGYDVELHVYGSFKTPQDHDRFVQLVSNYNVEGRVITHGFVSRDQLLKELHKYDIGLNLIRPTRKNRYTLQRKMLEYLAFGIPVIGKKGIYYFEKLVAEKGAGVAVEFGDLQDFIEAFHRIFSNYPNYSASALRVATLLSWDSQGARMLEYISKIIAT